MKQTKKSDAILKTPKIYTCYCCGKNYKKLESNFMPTKHPLFRNFGYYPVCKNCTNIFFNECSELFGSEDKAVEYIASVYGFYFNDSLLKSCENMKGKNKLTKFSMRLVLNSYSTMSWMDTLRERITTSSPNIVELPKYKKEDEEIELTEDLVNFWGVGFEPKVYAILQGFYNGYLQKYDDEPDMEKQKIMKTLSLLEYQMQTNIQAGGSNIATLSNSFSSLISKLKVDKEDMTKESYGKWLSEIEKYCPAELYTDKKKYRDFFGIGDYIERFMYRPLRNLIFGSKEREKEYWINDEDDIEMGDT